MYLIGVAQSRPPANLTLDPPEPPRVGATPAREHPAAGLAGRDRVLHLRPRPRPSAASARDVAWGGRRRLDLRVRDPARLPALRRLRAPPWSDCSIGRDLHGAPLQHLGLD